MSYKELYETVKAKLQSRKAITAIFIQMRYHTLQWDARRCIRDLQDEGLVSRDWDMSLGGYPVVSEKAETI